MILSNIDIISESVEQLRQLDSLSVENASNYLAYLGIAGAVITPFVIRKDKHKIHTDPGQGVESGDDQVAIDVLAVNTGTDKKLHDRRWAGWGLTTTGLGLVGVASLGLSVEHDVPVGDSAVVIVRESSDSTRLTIDTNDGTDSRDVAIQNGLFLSFPALLPEQPVGVINYGRATADPLELSTDRDLLSEKLQEEVADGSQDLLIPALTAAETMLDGYTIDAPTAILVLTDGAHEESTEEVADKITDIKAQGTDVRVVVVGTEDGGYKANAFQEDEIDSGINLTTLDDSVVASDEEAVSAAVSDFIEDKNTKDEKQELVFMKALKALGASMTVIGFLTMLYHTRKRKF